MVELKCQKTGSKETRGKEQKAGNGLKKMMIYTQKKKAKEIRYMATKGKQT